MDGPCVERQSLQVITPVSASFLPGVSYPRSGSSQFIWPRADLATIYARIYNQVKNTGHAKRTNNELKQHRIIRV